MLYQLSYAHHYFFTSVATTTARFKHPDRSAMVRPAGLEPAATRLEGGCSIQLSYGRLTHRTVLLGSI